jgi:hypothetical protein
VTAWLIDRIYDRAFVAYRSRAIANNPALQQLNALPNRLSLANARQLVQ